MAFVDFSSVLSTFEKCLESAEDFSEVRGDRADVFKSMTKTLYDSIQQTNDSEEFSCKVLPALIIENFDDEQVWQQLELQNTPVTAYFNKCLKGLNLDDVTFGVKKSANQSQHNNLEAREGDFSSDEGSGYAFDGSDSDDPEEQIPRALSAPKVQKTLKEHPKFSSTSVVDDQFFKISQMEEFLNYEDLKEERGVHNPGSDESDIDLFADIPSNDEDTDEEIDDGDEHAQKEKSKEIMYKDFFDPLEEEGYNSYVEPKPGISDAEVERFKEREYGGTTQKKKTVRFSESKETNGKLQLLDDSDDDSILNENLKSSSKTAFEKQQEKERKRMRELEESMLKKKPWQLTGEVAADSRPQDSLLHQDIEFDSNPKADFVSTDEMTERVENIIRMAVINKAWCDVEVKEMPIEEAFVGRPVVPLEHTKSKVSLQEVYENEFQRKQRNDEEEDKEDPRHVEIKKFMDSVASTLSTLFSHTPRPPIPEIKVVNNMPAITVEEVAPVGVSDATLLAPEEIKPKSGLPIGKSERTETDKKRERRKKKKLQKVRKVEEEEKTKKKASTSKKAATKYAKQQALKKISQQKNVTIVHEKKRMGKKS